MWFVRESKYRAAVKDKERAERAHAWQCQVIADKQKRKGEEILMLRQYLNKALRLLTPEQREQVTRDESEGELIDFN